MSKGLKELDKDDIDLYWDCGSSDVPPGAVMGLFMLYVSKMQKELDAGEVYEQRSN